MNMKEANAERSTPINREQAFKAQHRMQDTTVTC
jgi:hypothetical protein